MAIRTSTSTTNNVTERRESRYVQGGTADRFPTRVGWWERKLLPRSDTDFTIVIESSEDRRPDLVAARIYGKPSLQWLVLQYNNIVDIETEFLAGTEIRLPQQRRVSLDFLTQPTGGNRVR